MVTVLNALSLADWVCLAAAGLLFLGPGLVLVALSPLADDFSPSMQIAAAIAASVSLWAIGLAWFAAVGLVLNRVAMAAIFIASWATLVIHARSLRWQNLSLNLWRCALWAVVALTALVSLYALQGIAAGSGIDSYHHTVVAQLIIDRGGLPDDYQPFADLVSFTYHYGFHALVAALSVLTNIRVLSVLPIVGQLLMAAAALATAFLAEALFADKRITLLAAIVTGLLSAVPAAFGNWGRYPQLMGLITQSILIGSAVIWARQQFALRYVPVLSILAAGSILTHYRATLMTVVGLGVLFTFALARAARLGVKSRTLLAYTGFAAIAMACALVLAAPWFGHVIAGLQHGFPAIAGSANRDTVGQFFDLNRLGPGVWDHPNTKILILLAWAGLAAGLCLHETRVVSIYLWVVLMVLLSMPEALGGYMDTVSVAMSLFVPASAVIGWLVVKTAEFLVCRGRYWSIAAAFAFGILAVRGVVFNAAAIDHANVFVQKDDLEAIEWVRAHTPPSARFIVNLFHFGWDDRLSFGSDAGGWLPLLAGRQAVAPPMTAWNERGSQPDQVDRVAAVARLDGRLATPTGLSLMESLGASYVYIGARGGPIVVSDLMASPAFRLEFQSGPVYVFRRLSD